MTERVTIKPGKAGWKERALEAFQASITRSDEAERERGRKQAEQERQEQERAAKTTRVREAEGPWNRGRTPDIEAMLATGFQADGTPIPMDDWAGKMTGSSDPFVLAAFLRDRASWDLARLGSFLAGKGVPLRQRCEWLAANVDADGLTPALTRARAVTLADIFSIIGGR